MAHCVSSVTCLLKRSRPTTIARRVALVVVHPINGATSRTLTHISQEVFEGEPSLAHLDAPTAVPVVRRVTRIGAAVHHCLPRPVCRRIGPPVRRAPARGASCAPTAPEDVTPDDYLASASTLANPSSATSFRLVHRPPKHSPLTDRHPGHVDDSAHGYHATRFAIGLRSLGRFFVWVAFGGSIWHWL
jgi:hypothetical protein